MARRLQKDFTRIILAVTGTCVRTTVGPPGRLPPEEIAADFYRLNKAEIDADIAAEEQACDLVPRDCRFAPDRQLRRSSFAGGALHGMT